MYVRSQDITLALQHLITIIAETYTSFTKNFARFSHLYFHLSSKMVSLNKPHNESRIYGSLI